MFDSPARVVVTLAFCNFNTKGQIRYARKTTRHDIIYPPPPAPASNIPHKIETIIRVLFIITIVIVIIIIVIIIFLFYKTVLVYDAVATIGDRPFYT